MSKPYRLKGIDLAPSGRNRPDVERNLHRLHHVKHDAAPNAQAEEPMAGQTSVFVSESGDEVAILPSSSGPTVVEWISGSEMDPSTGDCSCGGLITPDRLTKLSDSAPKRHDKQPSAEDVKKVLLNAFQQLGLLDGMRQAARHPASRKTEIQQQASPQPANQSAEQEPTPAPAENRKAEKSGLLDDLPEVAQSTAANLIATALGNGLTTGDLLQGLAGGVANLGAGFLMGKLLGGPPDDSASTAEWAMTVLGPKLAKELLAGPLGTAMGKYLHPSPYASLALRVDDTDFLSNRILEGCPEPFVLIEGKAAAREYDLVDRKGLLCIYGAATVWIGGKNAAREDFTRPGYGTVSMDAAAPFYFGASKTYIGGISSNPCPPVPAEFKGEGMPPSPPPGTQPVADPNAPQSVPPGIYWDPKANEWRMWDPNFGWSATLSESYTSNAMFGTLPNWDLKAGSMFDIPGILKLGTSEWPGAGQGASWWVVDEWFPGLFGGSESWNLDMKKALSNLHDWLFHPQDIKGLSLLDHLIKTELYAFLSGFNYNPLQWLLKVIYSSATSLATVYFYLDALMESMNTELIGSPSRRKSV